MRSPDEVAREYLHVASRSLVLDPMMEALVTEGMVEALRAVKTRCPEYWRLNPADTPPHKLLKWVEAKLAELGGEE